MPEAAARSPVCLRLTPHSRQHVSMLKYRSASSETRWSGAYELLAAGCSGGNAGEINKGKLEKGGGVGVGGWGCMAYSAL